MKFNVVQSIYVMANPTFDLYFRFILEAPPETPFFIRNVVIIS